jgi:hypothetical protein
MVEEPDHGRINRDRCGTVTGLAMPRAAVLAVAQVTLTVQLLTGEQLATGLARASEVTATQAPAHPDADLRGKLVPALGLLARPSRWLAVDPPAPGPPSCPARRARSRPLLPCGCFTASGGMAGPNRRTIAGRKPPQDGDLLAGEPRLAGPMLTLQQEGMVVVLVDRSGVHVGGKHHTRLGEHHPPGQPQQVRPHRQRTLTTSSRTTTASRLPAGASGFLLKRTRREDMLAARSTIAAGEALLSPSVSRRKPAAIPGAVGR